MGGTVYCTVADLESDSGGGEAPIAEGASVEARSAEVEREGSGVWGGGIPLPTGEGVWGGG